MVFDSCRFSCVLKNGFWSFQCFIFVYDANFDWSEIDILHAHS